MASATDTASPTVTTAVPAIHPLTGPSFFVLQGEELPEPYSSWPNKDFGKGSDIGGEGCRSLRIFDHDTKTVVGIALSAHTAPPPDNSTSYLSVCVYPRTSTFSVSYSSRGEHGLYGEVGIGNHMLAKGLNSVSSQLDGLIGGAKRGGGKLTGDDIELARMFVQSLTKEECQIEIMSALGVSEADTRHGITLDQKNREDKSRKPSLRDRIERRVVDILSTMTGSSNY